MGNNQKFQRYDLVHIIKDLGSSMSHFTSDVDAIVLYSSHQEHGGEQVGESKYALYIRGQGTTAWYYDWQLTLIESNQKEKLHEFQNEVNRKQAELYDDFLAGKLKRILI